jgi:Leucine Rich repeat
VRLLTSIDLTENTFLNISHNQIGNNGAISIAKALKVNSSLISLDLSYNQIGNNGKMSIADAMASNLTLVSLIKGRIYYHRLI